LGAATGQGEMSDPRAGIFRFFADANNEKMDEDIARFEPH